MITAHGIPSSGPINYEFMGSQTSGDYTYFGYKENGGTNWRIELIDSDSLITKTIRDNSIITVLQTGDSNINKLINDISLTTIIIEAMSAISLEE